MREPIKNAGVSTDVRIDDLSEDNVRKISRVIEEQGGVEGDLRKEISMNNPCRAPARAHVARLRRRQRFVRGITRRGR